MDIECFDLLIVDYNIDHIEILSKTIAQKLDMKILKAYSGEEALNYIRDHDFVIVLVSVELTDISGLELVKILKNDLKTQHLPVILFSREPLSREFLCKGYELGVIDFFYKPYDDPIIFANKIGSLFSSYRCVKSGYNLNKKAISSKTRFNVPHIIAYSDSMKHVLSLVDKVSDSEETVLIHGESGTGKEQIARAIHAKSSRNNGPFISFNVGALSETLIESELFGHEVGAFTGANRKKRGRFELAQDGTIFLDEIGELSLSMQVKLLRILQEREFERVGGEEMIYTNARVIASTNRNLKQMKQDKTFREDLFYRLFIFPIHMDPLRERREDILPLAEYYLHKFARKKSIIGFTEEAKQKMLGFRWEGNVRELQNAISRAIVLCSKDYITDMDLFLLDDLILDNQLRDHTTKPDSIKNIIDNALEEVLPEQELLKIYSQAVLKKCNFNKKKTSKLLGIDFKTLVKRLK